MVTFVGCKHLSYFSLCFQSGIGTLWVRFKAAGLEVFDCPYKGDRANAEYRAITGCSRVPTEDGGGDGTACSHWEDTCLRSELMTGSPNRGDNPLSRITIGSLEDIGYTVDYSPAGNYTRDHVDPDCLCDGSDQSLRRRIAHGASHFLLDLNESTKPARRQLSDEVRQVAIDYGQALLQANSQAYALSRSGSSTSGSSIDSLEADGLLYIEDQIVSVLVQDIDDEIYGVVVLR
jgi:Leishmanolysin